jgi:DNA-binding CsgD family transcriptional regulator/tetratricopeptide (TPR) repeat protein
VADVLCPVLVGRAAELDALRSALVAVTDGSGGVVFVSGEPGVGKSRLVREISAQARARGVPVVAGRAVAGGLNTPYRPLTEALLQALRDRPFPDNAGLLPWLPALGAIVPIPARGSTDAGSTGAGGAGGGGAGAGAGAGGGGAAGAGAGAGAAGVPGHGDESPVVRGEAVLRLLRALADREPLVLVLEDLHWADPETLGVVEYLADNLRDEAVLCVATTRTEPPCAAAELASQLPGRGRGVLLPLRRLDDDQVADMVRACVPGAGEDVITRVRLVADGVPFLVEEVLAAPGVPRSLHDAVRTRLASLGAGERLVLQVAAVFGRYFDWRLLPTATGLPRDVIADALEHGVGCLLLTFDGDTFRFRHALTREAVLDNLMPHMRSAAAAGALAALESAHPGLPGPWRDVAASLAEQSGDRARAGELLRAAGEQALERGALVTAADTLRRAVELLDGGDGRARAAVLLIEALALAGRVDEAMTAGDRLIDELRAAGDAPLRLPEFHLQLAHAAVAAARWPTATRHIDAAEGLLATNPSPAVAARAAVLRAEVALAGADTDRGCQLAEGALSSGQATADVRCHALELIGRAHRLRDLDAARAAFERSLATAEAAALPVWQLRALHELGTIELFDHAGTARLLQARRIAGERGALSTSALLDMHLTAAFTMRFEVDKAADHARAAIAVSERLALSELHAIALVFLAEIHGMRRDRGEMERFIALAKSAAPGNLDIEGSGWAGARAILALLEGDHPAALAAFERGISLLRQLPAGGPAIYRGLWPLLLAAEGDPRAAAEIQDARRLGMGVNRANRGMLGYAEAVLAGRRGDQEQATDTARAADADLVHYPVWRELGRIHAAPAALADGWGEPRAWLDAAAECFAGRGFDALAGRCAVLLAGPRPGRWTRLGVTAREADVLDLVAEGLSNKEIATRLFVSPRTVEKHVESLLRKTGARSRTQLVARAGAAD